MSKSFNAIQYNYSLTTGVAFGGQLKWAVFTCVCHLPEWPTQSLGLDLQSRVDKFANKSGNFLVLCINSKPNMNVSIFETIRFKFYDFNYVAYGSWLKFQKNLSKILYFCWIPFLSGYSFSLEGFSILIKIGFNLTIKFQI